MRANRNGAFSPPPPRVGGAFVTGIRERLWT